MTRQDIHRRLAGEQGTLYHHGRRNVALVYPSPYAVGMSSLGFQAVYGVLNRLPDTAAERAFLPDPGASDTGPLLTYESGRPAADFPVVAFSLAYELELAGVFRCLELMGLEPRRDWRREGDPLVIAGGPLTFSNPLPLSPFADVIVMGESEGVLAPLLDNLFGSGSRQKILARTAAMTGCYVPAHHGESLPELARASDAALPAVSVITAPEATLRNMFLVEVERGCSRGCTFCVMRRGPGAGMRLVALDEILGRIPASAERVGLVGAAVSDHPRIVDIVRGVVDSGREIGLSSLRSDRLTPELVALLARGGARTLTVAADGASEVLRRGLKKKIRGEHLRRAAELAAAAGLAQLKLYLMVGVPGETDADLDEWIELVGELCAIAAPHTQLALGISPFVAKLNTPLAGAPFIGVREAQRRVDRLRRALSPRVDIRPPSARWAWVEYELAQGGAGAGLAALRAWRGGGRYADYKRAFPVAPVGAPVVAPVTPFAAGSAP